MVEAVLALGLGVALVLGVAFVSIGCDSSEAPADSAPPDSSADGVAPDVGADAPAEVAVADDAAGERAEAWPCSQILSCVTGCEGSVTCAQVCAARGSPKAQMLVSDFMACWTRVSKAECTVCTESGKYVECGTCVAFACFAESLDCLTDV